MALDNGGGLQNCVALTPDQGLDYKTDLFAALSLPRPLSFVLPS